MNYAKPDFNAEDYMNYFTVYKRFDFWVIFNIKTICQLNMNW